MSSKHKRKGRSKFLMVDGYIIRSAAWRALTPHGKAAYLELKWRYDGVNNGRIGLGCRDLAEALLSSKDTALRALEQLLQLGFIEKSKPSSFNIKHRVATEYRLTEYRCDVTGELATKTFMRWQPEKKQQAHQKDTQSHLRDSQPFKGGQKLPHGPRGETVKAVLKISQSHLEDTYSTTRGVAINAA